MKSFRPQSGILEASKHRPNQLNLARILVASKTNQVSDSSINSPAPQFAPLPNRSSVAPSTPAHSEIALPRIQYIDPQLPLQTSTPIGGVNNSSPQFSPTQLEQQSIQQQVPLPPQIGPVAPAPQGSFTTNITAPSTPQSSIGSLWWKTAVTEPLATDHATEQITVDSLLYAALQNSQQIQFISKEPLTREQEITTADAEFDPTAFASSVYEDTVDPVGNDLTTLSDPFLEENIWSGEAGIRRKTRSGGQVEVFQQLGFQNSNSQFFNPQDQGTSTLGLNFNQPLLSGGGKIFNRSQILLAQASTDLAWEEFSAQLQDELLNVVEAYWELYFRRAVFLQIQRNVKRGEAILRKVEGRTGCSQCGD